MTVTKLQSFLHTQPTLKGGHHLDKLAQLGTEPLSRSNIKESKKGTHIITRADLSKKAKRKFISQSLKLELLTLKSSPLIKQYGKSLQCNSVIIQTENKLTSSYCNYRWCITCNNIRTAKLINGYESVLKEIKEPQFVTLTIPNVKGSELAHSIREMITVMQRIQGRIKKQWQRGSRYDKLRGIRKIECTYNPDKGFHPHLHLIVNGEDNANAIVRQWLKTWKKCSPDAQNIKPIDTKNTGAMMELFKYFTKMTSKASSVNPLGKKDKTVIRPQTLDIMFQAMEGMRVFQPIGINKDVSEDIEELQSIVADLEHDNDVFLWDENYHNWINRDGIPLVQYIIPDNILKSYVYDYKEDT